MGVLLACESTTTSLLPWGGEVPTTPRMLCKTIKCNHNIGQTSQHLALAFNCGVQDN